MAQLKDLLPQIPKDELAILRDLNSKLDESKLTEATAKEAAQAVKTIVQNWKGWSQAMLVAMLLTPNIANALETYSPNTLDAIRTEISAEAPTKAATPTSIPLLFKFENTPFGIPVFSAAFIIAEAISFVNFSINFCSASSWSWSEAFASTSLEINAANN